MSELVIRVGADAGRSLREGVRAVQRFQEVGMYRKHVVGVYREDGSQWEALNGGCGDHWLLSVHGLATHCYVLWSPVLSVPIFGHCCERKSNNKPASSKKQRGLLLPRLST